MPHRRFGEINPRPEGWQVLENLEALLVLCWLFKEVFLSGSRLEMCFVLVETIACWRCFVQSTDTPVLQLDLNYNDFPVQLYWCLSYFLI